jgi:hypothetical protein
MGLGITVCMNDVISSSTCVVVPQLPRSEVFVTDLPHPLRSVRDVYKQMFACVPLIESVHLDTFSS